MENIPNFKQKNDRNTPESTKRAEAIRLLQAAVVAAMAGLAPDPAAASHVKEGPGHFSNSSRRPDTRLEQLPPLPPYDMPYIEAFEKQFQIEKDVDEAYKEKSAREPVVKEFKTHFEKHEETLEFWRNQEKGKTQAWQSVRIHIDELITRARERVLGNAKKHAQGEKRTYKRKAEPLDRRLVAIYFLSHIEDLLEDIGRASSSGQETSEPYEVHLMKKTTEAIKAFSSDFEDLEKAVAYAYIATQPR